LRVILKCFYFCKEEGESVKIKDIVKRTQPDTYSKLKPKKHSKEKLTERDCEELMRHSSYRRTGGAIRQVRQ
jgi:hypothetical protein